MGKPKHSNDRRGEQKGAQLHDEGQYGPKALSAKFAEISNHAGARRESERAITDPNRRGKSATESEVVAQHETELRDASMRDGRHRLFEGRKQHDEAEQGSDWNRRRIDDERHRHD